MLCDWRLEGPNSWFGSKLEIAMILIGGRNWTRHCPPPGGFLSPPPRKTTESHQKTAEGSRIIVNSIERIWTLLFSFQREDPFFFSL